MPSRSSAGERDLERRTRTVGEHVEGRTSSVSAYRLSVSTGSEFSSPVRTAGPSGRRVGSDALGHDPLRRGSGRAPRARRAAASTRREGEHRRARRAVRGEGVRRAGSAAFKGGRRACEGKRQPSRRPGVPSDSPRVVAHEWRELRGPDRSKASASPASKRAPVAVAPARVAVRLGASTVGHARLFRRSAPRAASGRSARCDALNRAQAAPGRRPRRERAPRSTGARWRTRRRRRSSGDAASQARSTLRSHPGALGEQQPPSASTGMSESAAAR